jgi:hypothetical protein
MTPKEKAKELVDKYSTYVVMWSGGIEVETQNVKQCTLIAVDEILNSLKSCWDEEGALISYNYWDEVKQELNNL